VGDTINNSTGAPSRGNAYFLTWYSTNPAVTISHARFSYAYAALSDYPSETTVTIRHCQFVSCGYGLFFCGGFGSVPATNELCLQNVLAAEDSWMVLGDVFSVNGENITDDTSIGGFAYSYGTGYTGNITNSIITPLWGGTNNIIFDHCEVAASDSGIYQTVGAASYYLATNSPYRGAGTTNIDAQTLADLETMTTYPPLVVFQGIADANITYSPVVQRNTGAMDYGYHYDPIDVAAVQYLINSTVQVLPGTVLAAYGGSSFYGILLTAGSTMNCQGTATSPSYIVNYNTVQEQSNTNWPYKPYGSYNGPAIYLFTNGPGADASSFYCRFTIWSQLAGGMHLFAGISNLTGSSALQDCQLFNGLLWNTAPAAYITNCLFQNVWVWLGSEATGPGMTDVFNNNLMVGGTLLLQELNSGDGPWSFQNNLFDQASITTPALGTDLCRNNAYVTTNFGTLTSPTNTGDQVLSNSPAYQVGALGQNYYPTNSSLIHAGDMSASAAGLYYYTVTTNNAVEGTNTVSIGFNYVAVGTNGLPLDTDANGIPNYLESDFGWLTNHISLSQDTSGDGIPDVWKILWGLNAGINNVNQVQERANYTYDGTGRLENDSSILGEFFSFDGEGNIQSDQP